MKQFKRVLALFLVLTMVLGMCPVLAVEAEEDGLLYLSSDEASNTEDPGTGSDGDTVQEEEAEYLFVYSKEEFDAALEMPNLVEIDIMEGTTVVLDRDVTTDKLIYVDAGASLVVPQEYTLTLTGTDGLALEILSMAEAENYVLPGNIITDAPVILMATEETLHVTEDATLDSGKVLGIFNPGRLDLADGVLVTMREYLIAGPETGYFLSCVGDNDSLVTLEDPDSGEQIRYLCGSPELVQEVLDEHPGWTVNILTMGAVGDDNTLTIVGEPDEADNTLYLGDRTVNSFHLQSETQLVLEAGVTLTVDELALFRHWDDSHTDKVLLTLGEKSALTVNESSFIRGTVAYAPSAVLELGGADVSGRYPHLSVDWLRDLQYDEYGPLWGEAEDWQTELYTTALDEPCLIFYATYFDGERWQEHPVVPQVDGGIEVHSLSDRVANGEWNGDYFVRLTNLQWDQTYTASWTTGDGQTLTLPIQVSLPNLGFYRENRVSNDALTYHQAYTAWDAFGGEPLTVYLGHVNKELEVRSVEWTIHHDGPQDPAGWITVGDRDEETGLYPVTIDPAVMAARKDFDIQVRYTINEDWVEEAWLNVWAEDMSIWVDAPEAETEDLPRDEHGNLCQFPYTAELGGNFLALAKDEVRTGMLYFVYWNDETDQWVCDPYGPEWFRDDLGLVSLDSLPDSDLMTITGAQYGEGQLLFKNGWHNNNQWQPNDNEYDDGGPLYVEVGGEPVYVYSETELLAHAANEIKELLVISADLTLNQNLVTNDTICMGTNEAMDQGCKLTLGKGVTISTTGGLELVVETRAEFDYALTDAVTAGEDKYLYIRGAFTLDDVTVPNGTYAHVMKGADLRVAKGKKAVFESGSMGFAHTNLAGEVTVPLHAKCSVFADAIYYKPDAWGNWTEEFRVLYGDEATMAADLKAKAAEGWSVGNLILSAATDDNSPGVIELESDLSKYYIDNLLIQDGSRLVLKQGAILVVGWLDILQVWQGHDAYDEVLLILEDGAALMADGGTVCGSGQWTMADVRLGEMEFEGHWPHLVTKWVYWDEETETWTESGEYEYHPYSAPDEDHYLAFYTAVWNEEKQDYDYAPVTGGMGGSEQTAPIVWSPDKSYITPVKVLEENTNYRDVSMHDFGTFVAVYTDGETFFGSMPLTIGLPELGFFRDPERSFESFIGGDGTMFAYGENGDWSNEFYIDLAGDAGFTITNWWTNEDQDWYHIEDLGNQMWKVVLHEDHINNDSGWRINLDFGFTAHNKEGRWPDSNQSINILVTHVNSIVSGVTDGMELVDAARSGAGKIRPINDITLSTKYLPEDMGGILTVDAELDFSNDTHLTLTDGVIMNVTQWPDFGWTEADPQDDRSRMDYGFGVMTRFRNDGDRPSIFYFAEDADPAVISEVVGKIVSDPGLEVVGVFTDSFADNDPYTLTMDGSWPALDLQTLSLSDNAALVLASGAHVQVDNLMADDPDINETMAQYQREAASKLRVQVNSGAKLRVRNQADVAGHLNWAADANVQFDGQINAAGFWPRLEHTWLEGSENGFVERSVTSDETTDNGGHKWLDYGDWTDCDINEEDHRIFFLRSFDGTNWVQTPVVPTFTIDGGAAPEDFVTSLEEEAAADQANKAYFVRFSLPDWNRTYTATGTANGYTLSFDFRTGLSDVGFYSQPEVKEDYFINHVALSPVEDTVFYLGFDIDPEQTYYVQEVIQTKGSKLLTMEKLDNGMYKLTIPAATARELGHDSTEARFTVRMTHDGVNTWNHDRSIGIGTHSAVAFSKTTHLTEAAALTDDLLAALQTEVKLDAGQSTTGTLYQVEYWENEQAWYVQPHSLDWFASSGNRGYFEPEQDANGEATGKAKLIANSMGLFQICRLKAEPDGNDSYRPTETIDRDTIPLDVVVSGTSSYQPYLSVGWLTGTWDHELEKDIFTENRNEIYRGFLAVPTDEWYAHIYYLNEYKPEEGRWVRTPVDVTIEGNDKVTLEAMPADQIRAGQVNGGKFKLLTFKDADWDTTFNICYRNGAYNLTMPVEVRRNNVGFYSSQELTNANWLKEYSIEISGGNTLYFSLDPNFSPGWTLSAVKPHHEWVTAEKVTDNVWKLTLDDKILELGPDEEFWLNLDCTEVHPTDGTYSESAGIRCVPVGDMTVTTEAELRAAANATTVGKIVLGNDITLTSPELLIIYNKELNLNGKTLTLGDGACLAVDQLPLTGSETGGEAQHKHPDVSALMLQIDSFGAVLYDDGKMAFNTSLQQMKEDIWYRLEEDDSAPYQIILDDSATAQTLTIDGSWPQLNLGVLMLNPGWSLEVTDGAQVNTDWLLAYTVNPDGYEPGNTVRIQVSGGAYLGIHSMARIWGHINWTSGGWIDLPGDTMHWGDMPELAIYWLRNDGQGWYKSNDRTTGFGATPADEIRHAVFFAKVWDNGGWTEQPVYAGDGMNRVSVFRGLGEYEEHVVYANPDDPVNDYFVVLDSSYADWDQERTFSADWQGTHVEMPVYFGYGDSSFFSQPEAKPEHFLNHYRMTRDGENSFYFVLDNDRQQLEGVYNWVLDEQGNVVEDKSLSGWDKVTVSKTENPNVYKITVKDGTDVNQGFDFELYFRTYQLDGEGNVEQDEDGNDIVHGRHHVGIWIEAAEPAETLALLRIDDVEYHITEENVYTHDEDGPVYENKLGDFFYDSVDYDLEHNTLILNNAKIGKLELGYSWDGETFLPNRELRIQVSGTNFITNYEDHAVILHDGIKAIFQGNGTLNVAVHNADGEGSDDNYTFDAFLVNDSELVLGEGVTVSIEAEGEGYQYHDPAHPNDLKDKTNWNPEDGYFYENDEKAPCHIRALSSHEGGILTVQEGATLTAKVPNEGRYNGIEGFDQITVRGTGSTLTTQSIRFHSDNTVLDVCDGAAVTVTGVEEHHVGVDDNDKPYNDYNISAVSVNNGYIKVWNGGKLNVTTGAFSDSTLENVGYHVSGIDIYRGGFRMAGSTTAVTIDLDGSNGWTDGLHVGNGEIEVQDGSLTVNINGGVAMALGGNPDEDNRNPQTVLNHSGGTITIKTGEKEEDASGYQIAYGSIANFTGSSVNTIRAFRALSNNGTVNFRDAAVFNATATEWAYDSGLVVNEPNQDVGRLSALNVYGGTLNLTNDSGLTGRMDEDGNAITVGSVLNNCNEFLMTGGTINIRACNQVINGIDCCGVNLISGGTINIGVSETARPLTGINVWPDGSLTTNYLRLAGGTVNTHGIRRGAILLANTYLQGGSFNAEATNRDLEYGAIGGLVANEARMTVVGGTHTFTAPDTSKGIGLQAVMSPIVISGGSVTARAGNAVYGYYQKDGNHVDDPTFYNMFTLSTGIHAKSNTNGNELQFIEYKALTPAGSNEYGTWGDYTTYEAWLDDDNENKLENGVLEYTAKDVTFSSTPGTLPEEPEQPPVQPDDPDVPETVVLSDLEITSSRSTVGSPVSLRASVTVEHGDFTVTLPTGLILNKNSVAINNVLLQQGEGFTLLEDGNSFTIPAISGSAIITFQVIPMTTDISYFMVESLLREQNEDGSYTGKTSRSTEELWVEAFKLSAPTSTSNSTITVSGEAAANHWIFLEIRSKSNLEQNKIISTQPVKTTSLGTFVIEKVGLPISDPEAAQSFTIDAVMYADGQEEKQTVVGSVAVVYNPSLVEVQYLEITNQIHGNSMDEILDVKNRINYTNGTGTPERSFYTYWPELKTFRFEAGFDLPENTDWEILEVRVDVTYRNGLTGSCPLQPDLQRPGVWTGEADLTNAPVDFTIWYKCRQGVIIWDPIIISPTPITPIMDPSGTVTINGQPVKDATVTIYYGGSGEEPHDEHVTKKNSSHVRQFLQQNPQITDASGSFHWDVPEGWWKVVAEKGSYSAETQWLKVMPAHMGLEIELEPAAEDLMYTMSLPENIDLAQTTIDVPVTVTNTALIGDTMIAVAAYDENGRYLGITFGPQVDLKYGQSDTYTVRVENTKGEVEELRAFLVDAMDTLTPMGPSQSYPAK